MSRPRRRLAETTIRPIGLARRTRAALLVTTALQAAAVLVLAVPAHAQPAPNARPIGGVIVGGAATIARTATATAINQTTARAAINWLGFDVGSKQSVTFQQPTAQSITLNTVTGPNPSSIAGRITANGQILLVNQSGVTFFKGAQVNTSGLAVSAAGANAKHFMAGGAVVLDQPGKANARIVNNGNITIAGAGLATLVAPAVANAGVIDARLGHIVLAGAKTATLDLYGDKLVSVAVTGAVSQAPIGVDSLVTNTGILRADGGTVRLTARAVDGVISNLVTAGGTIQANTRGERQGRVTIDGVGGSITIDGAISAEGRDPGTKGGQIGLLASHAVTVKSGASLNASGAAGGGVIAIGTTLRRAMSGPTTTTPKLARTVTVQKGATIAAGATATATGDGGRVVLLSAGATSFDGQISAKGIANGGFVEISGKTLRLTGEIDVSAASGKMGQILLDPDYLNIVTGGTADAVLVSGTIAGNDGTPSTLVVPATIDPATIAAFNGNVTLQANQTLTVASDLSLTNQPNQRLVLQAGGTLTINSGVHLAASGDLILATGGAGPSSIALPAPAAQASPAIGVFGDVTSTGGSVSLLSGPGGTVTIGSTGAVTAASGRRVTIQTDTLIGLGPVTAASGIIEIAPATHTAMSIGDGPGLAVSQTTLSNLSTQTLRLGGATIEGGLIVTATAITVVNDVSIGPSATTLDLRATGAVTQSGALLSVGTLTGSAANFLLTNADNTIGQLGGQASGGTLIATGTGGNPGTIAINTAQPLTLSGLVSAGVVDLTADTISQASTGTLIAGTLISAGGSGTVVFAGSANQVGVIGDFHAESFSLNTNSGLLVSGAIASNDAVTLTASGALTVAGTLSATDIVLSGTALSLPGDLLSNSGGGVSLRATNGGISQTGTIVTGALTGSATGAASLTGATPSANQISFLSDFSAAALTLNVGHALVVAGTVTAATGATIAAVANSLSIQGTVSAAAIVLSGASLAIPGLVTDGGAGTVSLTATAGRILETGTLIAGTLSGSANGGTVALTGAALSANRVAAIGTFASTGGTTGFSLNDGAPLSINGLIDGGASAAINAARTLSIPGTVSATAIALRGTAISIGGLVTDGGAGTVALTATNGSIDAPGTLIAGVLSGSATGSAAFTNPVNQIGSAAAFPTGAGYALTNAASFVIDGTIIATTGDIVLRAAGSGRTLTLGAGGDLIANNGTVSLRADAFAIAVGASVAARVFELSPDTPIPLGIAGSPVWLTAGTVRLGQTRGTTTATVIGFFSDFDLNNGGSAAALDMRANGAITDGGFKIGNVSTLTGSATGGGVTLNHANTIAAIGDFTTTGGFAVSDAAALLTVNGQITAGTSASPAVVTLSGNALTLTGTILTSGAGPGVGPGAGAVGLNFNLGTISGAGVIGTATLTAAAGGIISLTGANRVGTLAAIAATGLTFNDTQSLTLSGLVSVGNTGAMDIRDTGANASLSETASGTIIAGRFQSTGGIPGDITLLSLANAIGTIAGLTAGGAIAISDSVSGAALTGAFHAPNGNIFLRDTGANGWVIGSGVSLIAAPGGSIAVQANRIGNIGLNGGGVVVNAGVTGLIELAPYSAAPITFGATAAGFALSSLTGLTAATLRLGAITPLTGGAPVTTASAITIGGIVDAASLTTLDLRANGGIVEAAIGRLVNLATLQVTSNGAAGDIRLGDTLNSIGTLLVGSVVNGDFVFGDTAPSGSVTVAARQTILANNVSIASVGGLAVGGSIIATVGTVALSAIGPTSDLTLTGATVAAPVTVFLGAGRDITQSGGAINAGTIIATGGGLLTANGALSATSRVTLTGTALALAGVVSAGTAGAIGLIATNGGISQTGTLIALGLTGSATGAASLAGATATANQIQAVGSFSAASFVLNDGTSVTFNGPLSGGSAITVVDSGLVTVSGSAAATAISLTGTALALPGVVTDGGNGSVALIATTGAIGQTGTLIAGSLSGSAAGAATFTGANPGANPGANQIATLTGFSASGFSLNDGRALSIPGTLNGGASATVVSLGLLSIGGTVSAAAIALTGSALTIPGLVTDGGAGSVGLTAISGAVNETGTLIAGTLSGAASGSMSLTGAANQIAVLGDLNAASLILNDGVALSVAGTVNAGSGAAIVSNAALSIGGTVSATALALTGTAITIDGRISDGGAGTTRLIATTGGIDATNGTVIAGTLSATSPGALTLPNANQIGTIGAISSGGITLNTISGLTLAGVATGGPVALITSAGAINVTGTLDAVQISLSGTALTIPGQIGLNAKTPVGILSLIATNGGISETGIIAANTLFASATGAIALTGATPTVNRIAVLGGAQSTSLLLNDGSALSVDGPVTGTNGATLLTAGALTINSVVSGGAIALTGASIAIPGTVTDGGGGIVRLTATAGGITETGTLIAGTLSGDATGAMTLTGAANRVARLGAITANGFSLNDGVALSVPGSVSGGTSAAIVSAGPLAIGGTVTASAISLTGTDLSIGGLVSGGTVTLAATTGAIQETGTLLAGTLIATSAGTAFLNGGSTFINQIGTLGDLTVSSLTLNTGLGLLVKGSVNAGGNASIVSGGGVSVAGALTAANVSLTGTTIAIPGTITANTALSLSSLGALTIPGTLSSGAISLTGASIAIPGTVLATNGATVASQGALTIGGVVSAGFVSLSGGPVTIGGAVTSGSGATIVSTGSLSVIGTVIASGSASAVSQSALRIGGTLSARSVSLTGGPITIGGTVTSGSGATIVSTGSLSVSGAVIASGSASATSQSALSIGGTLSAGTVSLTGGPITIGGTVTSGSSATVAAAGALSVDGTIAAASLSLTGEPIAIGGMVTSATSASVISAGSLSVNGTIAGASIALSGTAITIPGVVRVNDGAGSVSLIATAGGIDETGILIAGSLSGRATGAMSLTGASIAANQIGVLGDVSAGAGFTLFDGIGLTVTGTVTGGPRGTLTSAGDLTVNGLVSAAAIALTGATIAIPGTVSDGGAGTVRLIATGAAASDTLKPLIFASQTAAGAGTITETGGLIAGTLTASAPAAISLTGINRIAVLGDVSAASFTLRNDDALPLPRAAAPTLPLEIRGVINAGASADIFSFGPITVSGRVLANAISLSGSTLALPGVVSDGGSGFVRLEAFGLGGGIGQTGTLIAGTLSGRAAGAASLAGTNSVANLADFAAQGFVLNNGVALSVIGVVSGATNVAITDSAPVTIGGTIAARSITLTASALTISGLVTDNCLGVVTLIATNGSISDTGTLAAGLLTINAAGAVSLTGATPTTNQVLTLGNISASSFVLNDGKGLTIGGTVTTPNGFTVRDQGDLVLTQSAVIRANTVGITGTGSITASGSIAAPLIVIDNGTGTFTSNGLAITTGGHPRPLGAIPSNRLPTATSGDLGFYLTTGQFTQRSGPLTAASTTVGDCNIVRIDAVHGIQFSPIGLNAPATWLILGLTGANAKAMGPIVAKDLDLVSTGQGSGASLTGTLNGLIGNAAAGAGHILPNINTIFQINGCPISSVNCVLLPTQGIPQASPLRDYVAGSIFNPGDEEDLLLPLVSDEVY